MSEQTTAELAEQARRHKAACGKTAPAPPARLIDGPAFFQRLAAARKDNLPRPAASPTLMRPHAIGLSPRKPFDAL